MSQNRTAQSKCAATNAGKERATPRNLMEAAAFLAHIGQGCGCLYVVSLCTSPPSLPWLSRPGSRLHVSTGQLKSHAEADSGVYQLRVQLFVRERDLPGWSILDLASRKSRTRAGRDPCVADEMTVHNISALIAGDLMYGERKGRSQSARER
eukprot:1833753-Rhodomonas_salina.1